MDPEIVPTPDSPVALSDDVIVDRVRAGEAALFELLMRRYNQRVYRLARSVVRDESEAEDIVQEAFVRAYQGLERFEGRASFATWLTRIALYEALARRRRGLRAVAFGEQQMEATASMKDPLPTRWGGGGGSPEDRAGRNELRSALCAAVDGLPDTLRTVFVLREIEGLDTAETADSLEISEANVKVRLHRARAQLRSDLEHRLGEEVGQLFGFAGARCDRAVARVFARLRIPRGEGGGWEPT